MILRYPSLLGSSNQETGSEVVVTASDANASTVFFPGHGHFNVRNVGFESFGGAMGGAMVGKGGGVGRPASTVNSR